MVADAAFPYFSFTLNIILNKKKTKQKIHKKIMIFCVRIECLMRRRSRRRKLINCLFGIWKTSRHPWRVKDGAGQRTWKQVHFTLFWVCCFYTFLARKKNKVDEITRNKNSFFFIFILSWVWLALTTLAQSLPSIRSDLALSDIFNQSLIPFCFCSPSCFPFLSTIALNLLFSQL